VTSLAIQLEKMTITNEELRGEVDGLKVEVDDLKLENAQLKVEHQHLKVWIFTFVFYNILMVYLKRAFNNLMTVRGCLTTFHCCFQLVHRTVHQLPLRCITFILYGSTTNIHITVCCFSSIAAMTKIVVQSVPQSFDGESVHGKF